MKIYTAFNIIFQSQIEIPEFLESNKNPQVFIRYGKVTYPLPIPTHRGVRFQTAENLFVFKMDNVALYQVSNGNEIIIEKFANSDEKDIRLFLLGTVMGALIHQRGILPFHGSAIVINDKCIIISGISGMGKSTLAAFLIKKGYKLLADDISTISFEKNKAFVNPSFPNIKLWQDALEKINDNCSNYEKIRKNINKFQFPVNQSFSESKKELTNIYILNKKNSIGIDTTHLKGIDKFTTLQNNTYRFQFIKGLGKSVQNFKIIQNLSQLIEVIKISKPNEGNHFENIAKIIEKDQENFK